MPKSMSGKDETPKAATNGASSEPNYCVERFEMEHTANPTLRQGQEYIYQCVTFLFSYMNTVQGLGDEDRVDARGHLADALLTILRAAPPKTSFDNAKDDKDFQRFKNALTKKPRKNSRLAKSLSLH